MSNVLIWKKVSPGSEYDIFRGVDAEQEYLLGLKNGCYNIGNRLWLQGIMSAIDTQENKYDFLPNQIDPDRINVEYDFIILPMANIFNEKYSTLLEYIIFSSYKGCQHREVSAHKPTRSLSVYVESMWVVLILRFLSKQNLFKRIGRNAVWELRQMVALWRMD